MSIETSLEFHIRVHASLPFWRVSPTQPKTFPRASRVLSSCWPGPLTVDSCSSSLLDQGTNHHLLTMEDLQVAPKFTVFRASFVTFQPQLELQRMPTEDLWAMGISKFHTHLQQKSKRNSLEGCLSLPQEKLHRTHCTEFS